MAEFKKLGRYELRRVLGKGAMGVVYEGYDPTLSRRVAVKTILKSVALDEETERAYAERFAREAKAVARLNHPNIVQVFDFGMENEVAYLVMEFIQGRELRDAFAAGERFGTGGCVRIMGELLDALDFAHEAGVIHRDVKPANVMLDAQQRVKLTDFGVARVQDSERSAAGTMVGTPAFMSPEQIQGLKVDRRTDIFSAGTILYQLLTGEQPFRGEGAWTVAKKIMEEHPPQPSTMVKTVSPAFDAIVAKALAKSAAQRFASASEFAAALRGTAAAGAPAKSGTTPRPRTRPEAHASEAEVEFWRSIQNSTDASEFEFYLEQFPEGTYAQLARHKIAKLKGASPAEDTVRLEAEAAAKRRAEEEKVRQETEARAKREAEERARREAAERSKREAEEKQRREAQERARREAEEAAKRVAAEKAKREAEEKARQAQALARLKRQEEAAAKARAKAAAVDEDSTVALPSRREPAAGAAPVAAQKARSLAVPAAITAVVVVGGIAAYLFAGRTPAPAPVAETAPPKPAAAPAPPAAPAVDPEKIRRETEERLRKEYAEKAATERAALERSLAEKIAAEADAAKKVAEAKSATEKAAAEKAVAAAAARQAAEKVAAEKAAADRANAEKAAAERATVEKAVAEKLAAEKVAAEKAAAAKAAATAKPGWPSVGDRWVYEAQDADRPEKKFQVSVEVQNVTAAGIGDLTRVTGGQLVGSNQTALPQLVGVGPGFASFFPYLGAFQELKVGGKWVDLDFKTLWQCSTGWSCRANASIVGRERVTVRAGSYDTWKIVVVVVISGATGGSGEFTYWYASAAKRFVKYQSRVRVSGYHTWTQPDIDMELVSYTPVGAK